MAGTNWFTTDSSQTKLKSMWAGVDFAWLLGGVSSGLETGLIGAQFPAEDVR
jgi:hypothetical protein